MGPEGSTSSNSSNAQRGTCLAHELRADNSEVMEVAEGREEESGRGSSREGGKKGGRGREGGG